MYITQNDINRFWEKINFPIDHVNDCWIYTGYCEKFGHGTFHMNINGENTMIKDHRFIWEVYNGPIPNGLCVLHNCDNPPCVNPKHLFLGTKVDNNKDRHSKNRSGSAKGENHGRAILTEDDIVDIKIRLRCGESGSSIARYYGVQPNHISKIKLGKLWPNVKLNI